MQTNQSTLNKIMNEIAGYIAAAPFFALFVSSVGIFLYQIYFYAKNGNWISISISDLTNFEWLQNNWLGIYKILAVLPASLTLFVLSWIVLFFTATLIDSIKKQ